VYQGGILSFPREPIFALSYHYNVYGIGDFMDLTKIECRNSNITKSVLLSYARIRIAEGI
jgi:hypothetical protein